MRRNLSTALQRWSSNKSSELGAGSSQLCRSCQNLTLTDKHIGHLPRSHLPNGGEALDLTQGFIDLTLKKRDRSPRFEQLQAAAEAGCKCCAALYDAIRRDRARAPEDWHEKLGDGEVILRFRYACMPALGLGILEAGQWHTMLSGLEVVFGRKDKSHSEEPIILVFKVHCESDPAVGDFLRIRRREVDENVLSPRNVRLIKDWIQDCRYNHYACSPLASASEPARPTRLVYVGNRSSGTLPRLVLSQHLPKDVRFAALSYCWGAPGSMRLTTTMETLHERLYGIPWNYIPRAFLDAFHVAVTLGLEYVWIDALCIIQDDERDWQVEATMMGDIYRGAQITLVAASSASTNEGFIDRVDRHAEIRLSFETRKSQPISGHYSLMWSPQGYEEEFKRDVEHSVWNSRGWCFQERQLSRRVLFFGKRKVYFECKMHRREEGFAGPLNRSLALYKHMQNNGDDADMYMHVLQLSWRKIVEEFSRRNFTYEKDRLPALSGIAQEIYQKAYIEVKETRSYLAGLWLDAIEMDLAWLAETEEQRPWDFDLGRRPEERRSPTWSWVTYPGKVSWHKMPAGASFQSLCVVENATTQLNASDPFGGVASGFIEITGYLLKIDIPDYHKLSRVDEWQAWDGLPSVRSNRWITTYHFDYPDLSTRTFWWAPLGQVDSMQESYTIGLMLIPTNMASDQASLNFKRLGVFRRTGQYFAWEYEPQKYRVV